MPWPHLESVPKPKRHDWQRGTKFKLFFSDLFSDLLCLQAAKMFGAPVGPVAHVVRLGECSPQLVRMGLGVMAYCMSW